jgi:iron complex outermembrane receptor protein
VDPANVGNPDLSVEEGWSAEVGLEYRHPVGLLSLTGFLRETENLIDWARPDGSDASVPWETRNVEEARHRGVEVSLQEVRFGGLALRATGAWLQLEATESEGFFSKSSLRPIHREFTVQASAPLPDGSALSVLAADRRRLGGEGGVTMDVRLELPLGDARWYVDALNVTDEAYPDITGLPIPGRAFIVGVRAPFGG